MTLNEIKAAVERGQTVCWANAGYEVLKDEIGQWLVVWNRGGRGENYCGLTHRDGVTMNHDPAKFYVKE